MPSLIAEDNYEDYYKKDDKGNYRGSDWNERYTRETNLIHDVLQTNKIDIAKTKILDVGCGFGGLLQKLSMLGAEIAGIDLSGSGKQIAEEIYGNTFAKTIQIKDISFEKLPYEDNTFDIGICIETIEHLQNPHFAIKELKRVTKPNGVLFLSIPNRHIGHDYIYPGLFTYKNFKLFLEQEDCSIQNIYTNSRLDGNRMLNSITVEDLEMPLAFISAWLWYYVCINKK